MTSWLLLAPLFLTGCPRPGAGAKAEAWYRKAEPVIAALNRYRTERGSYPNSLAELPADWLPPLEERQPHSPDRGFAYARKGDAYELTFSYAGPGINHCTHYSAPLDDRRWSCGGDY